MLRRRLDLWLPTYLLTAPERLRGRWQRRRGTHHVLFLICDHFEPRHGASDFQQAADRLRRWREGYAGFQSRCREAFGHSPRHTWFYPPHHGTEHLKALAEFQFLGLGEIELHYHHDGDTSASLRRNLQAALASYQQWGLLLESGEVPRPAFGFVHGDWALDNSCHGKYCGVNDELTILQELGCWGDFTMPSANECQTRKINAIYYAVDDPQRPKSHDGGRNAAVGQPDSPGLFMMQGPLGINWKAPGYPRIENASLTSENWGRQDRIEKWLDCHVHVRGRPEWTFIKLHTHGAIERDFDALFGDKAFEMHRLLNQRYNDGRHYRLHYVTARQAYNIAKAAEHGMTGDPWAYRDFRIAPYATSHYFADRPHRLRGCTSTRLHLDHVTAAEPSQILSRGTGIARIRGRFTSLEIDAAVGETRLEGCAAGESLEIELEAGVEMSDMTGARVVENRAGGALSAVVADRDRVTIQFRRGVERNATAAPSAWAAADGKTTST